MSNRGLVPTRAPESVAIDRDDYSLPPATVVEIVVGRGRRFVVDDRLVFGTTNNHPSRRNTCASKHGDPGDIVSTNIPRAVFVAGVTAAKHAAPQEDRGIEWTVADSWWSLIAT